MTSTRRTSEAQKILKRAKVKPAVDREVWAKAAGRCVLCSAYLLSPSWDFAIYAVGQVAHIIGATDADGSPRGDSPLTAEERAEAHNLMLLCYPCHKRADANPTVYTEGYLLELKDQFEQRVREVTNFASLEPTVVVRLTSPIRGNEAIITDSQVAEALRDTHLTYAGEDVRAATERILLNIAEDVDGAWSAGSSLIEKKVDRALRAIEDTSAQSLSVFALAPVPFLVKLGHRIGTKHATHVFERHRVDDRGMYRWPDTSGFAAEFSIDCSKASMTQTDVVARVSITASVQVERAPATLHQLPIVDLALIGGPRSGAISSPEALSTFAAAWRDALQLAEERFPKMKRLHLLTAAPISASIELGRHLMRDSHPQMVVYQLNPQQKYEYALTVG